MMFDVWTKAVNNSALSDYYVTLSQLMEKWMANISIMQKYIAGN